MTWFCNENHDHGIRYFLKCNQDHVPILLTILKSQSRYWYFFSLDWRNCIPCCVSHYAYSIVMVIGKWRVVLTCLDNADARYSAGKSLSCFFFCGCCWGWPRGAPPASSLGPYKSKQGSQTLTCVKLNVLISSSKRKKVLLHAQCQI